MHCLVHCPGLIFTDRICSNCCNNLFVITLDCEYRISHWEIAGGGQIHSPFCSCSCNCQLYLLAIGSGIFQFAFWVEERGRDPTSLIHCYHTLACHLITPVQQQSTQYVHQNCWDLALLPGFNPAKSPRHTLRVCWFMMNLKIFTSAQQWVKISEISLSSSNIIIMSAIFALKGSGNSKDWQQLSRTTTLIIHLENSWLFVYKVPASISNRFLSP